MHGLLPGLKKRDMEALALYFSSQTPTVREKAPFGDPAAGEPLTAVCGGCHGQHGISLDSSTPSLSSSLPTNGSRLLPISPVTFRPLMWSRSRSER